MSHVMELRLVLHHSDLFGGIHDQVFWNYASYINQPEKIQEMREFARQKSKGIKKGMAISLERMTRYKEGYYWRTLNKFSDGADITE